MLHQAMKMRRDFLIVRLIQTFSNNLLLFDVLCRFCAALWLCQLQTCYVYAMQQTAPIMLCSIQTQ